MERVPERTAANSYGRDKFLMQAGKGAMGSSIHTIDLFFFATNLISRQTRRVESHLDYSEMSRQVHWQLMNFFFS